MKIGYINSNRLYNAIFAGGIAVINNQDYLNKINVFPVADADTGINMASTMRSIIEGTRIFSSVRDTCRSVADSALMGARGNSGLIFAQFIHGLSSEVEDEKRIRLETLAFSLNTAVHYAYKSILEPVEGTMLTVMKDWSHSIETLTKKNDDIFDVLNQAYQIAQTSLAETPRKLKILADSGVVDAGAKGFVIFLEGIMNFILNGKLKHLSKQTLPWFDAKIHADIHAGNPIFRYCTEAIIHKSKWNVQEVQNFLSNYGDSIVVAGEPEKIHLHLHTNQPAELFFSLKKKCEIAQIKIDDMEKQVEVNRNRKFPIALVTDSACDIPDELIEHYQIHMIPFQISFGSNLFLDKLTLTSEQFYEMLKTDKHHPQSSQPNYKTIQNLFSFLSSHYESIIAIHISDQLSGVFQQSITASKTIENKLVTALNSRHLSVSEGLIVMRAAQAIEAGFSHGEIVKNMDEWIKKTHIYVDINTLKYMVRGGRVSPMKGFIAGMLNLKPIVSLDAEGKGIAFGKSFSRKANMKKIVAILAKMKEKGEIWNYSIVHSQAEERARAYAEQLTKMFEKPPAYIMNISPVVGVHNGIGALAIGIMLK